MNSGICPTCHFDHDKFIIQTETIHEEMAVLREAIRLLCNNETGRIVEARINAEKSLYGIKNE